MLVELCALSAKFLFVCRTSRDENIIEMHNNRVYMRVENTHKLLPVHFWACQTRITNVLCSDYYRIDGLPHFICANIKCVSLSICKMIYEPM